MYHKIVISTVKLLSKTTLSKIPKILSFLSQSINCPDAQVSNNLL